MEKEPPPPASFVAPPRQFFEAAATRDGDPAYFVRGNDGWAPESWRNYAASTRRAARALLALGVQAGESVCILSFNRPEWTTLDIAAMAVGARPAGVYWTSAPEQVAYILKHSGCRVALFETSAQFAALAPYLDELPALERIIMMPGADATDAMQMEWATFLALGEERLDDQLEERLDAIGEEDIGKQIYTSGTTGHPKAVQISHGALWWTSQVLTRAYGSDRKDRLISYLPLAHIAEQMATVHQHIDCGYPVYFARSMDELGNHLKEVRPTVFFAVPRVFEKMAAAIQEKSVSVTGIKRRLFDWATNTARRWHLNRMDGNFHDARASLALGAARRIILKKVRAALGLDAARLVLVGAAPISRETLDFFAGLDLPLCEVYGQSETTGPTTLNLPHANRIGSVGRPPDGIDVRIADDGEVLVRGRNLFSGYAGDPQTTEKTLRDGWLYSGDIGEIDEDGYLHITGRKKDLIVTSGGKNISPAAIERDLMALPGVEHAIACGDRRNYVCALISLDESSRAALEASGDSARALAEVKSALQAGIDQVNRRHSRAESVRRFELLERPLSLEAGELTPTMKICRAVVLSNNAAVIDRMYSEG